MLRMDGRDKPEKREANVKEFQKNKNIRAFLLTTGVGSVGLTLTAATRVIVFDPAWNPSCDDQGRAHYQKRSCYIIYCIYYTV